ncbi:unnamed protein product [Schistosoma rodhaini]|uniref:Uncharacterized protein n=1 Tax=Schistosoma rodhaini TaxID=6188 RepID=A0AA85G7E5_9TREM|nr:unnamed protein product [Schistosoma rodhaini]
MRKKKLKLQPDHLTFSSRHSILYFASGCTLSFVSMFQEYSLLTLRSRQICFSFNDNRRSDFRIHHFCHISKKLK